MGAGLGRGGAGMNDDEEVSASGAPIYRHAARERPFEPAIGDAEAIQRIASHLERFLGEAQTVWHELVSDLVHVDVHVFAPRPDRPFYTLVTSGMSDLPMAVPEGAGSPRHAELLLCLPPEWPLDEASFQDERHYWPVRALKSMARFPHEYGTWLGWGHTVPNGDPPAPLAPGVSFTTLLVERPVTLPPEAHDLPVSPERTISFFSIVPLHDDEVRLKMAKGIEALEALFDEKGVSELLDVRRPSVARRKWLGIF